MGVLTTIIIVAIVVLGRFPQIVEGIGRSWRRSRRPDR